MPSVTGGDSSARDYAPHMWVLSVEGSDFKDEDYHFVGNATAFYDDPKTNSKYHIGVTTLGELVGDVTPDQYKTLTGIPREAIPEAAKKRLAEVGLKQIGTLAGHIILDGLGIATPPDAALLDFDKIFNGTPAEQAAEQLKEQQWQTIADGLRQTLGIE